jgi:hypothetical protein
MVAPTKAAANVKKAPANSEPSTHGTLLRSLRCKNLGRRPFRLLTVVDCHTRESLAIVPRPKFKVFQVVDVLDRLAKERGKPKTIRCDNGPSVANGTSRHFSAMRNLVANGPKKTNRAFGLRQLGRE